MLCLRTTELFQVGSVVILNLAISGSAGTSLGLISGLFECCSICGYLLLFFKVADTYTEKQLATGTQIY